MSATTENAHLNTTGIQVRFHAQVVAVVAIMWRSINDSIFRLKFRVKYHCGTAVGGAKGEDPQEGLLRDLLQVTTAY
jgi:hypothetical protein